MTAGGAEWLAAFLPLGVVREQKAWAPLGAGVLLIDPPILWLVTARSTLQRAGDQTLSAFVSEDQGGTVLDLVSGRRGTAFDWLEDTAAGLVACLFPVDRSWPVKAFPEAACVTDELEPGSAVWAVGAVYGQPLLGERPSPLVLPGILARRDAEQLVTTAPLPPMNLGAPLLVPVRGEGGSGAALAGIVTAILTVPAEPGIPAASLRLSVATPVAAALSLIRSEAGKAQRRLAIERSRPSPQEEEACSP